MVFQLDKLKREKGSYLGVIAEAASPVLRKQLGLSAGMGLVVEFVAPESPASAAGVQQYDVLQKLDDQLLVNQEQLAVLVRSHKPGEEVKLAIIREGKPTTLTAKLAEHDLEPWVEAGENEPTALFRRAIPSSRVRPINPGERPPALGWKNPAVPNGASTTTWLENDHSYSLVTTDGHRTFVAKDKEGKVLFDGPVDTEEQREKLPPELKEKLQHLIDHMGGGFRSGRFGEARQPEESKKPGEKDSDAK